MSLVLTKELALVTKLLGHKPETFLADNQHLALRRELVLDCPGEIRVELGEGQTEEEPREVVVQLALHDGPLITNQIQLQEEFVQTRKQRNVGELCMHGMVDRCVCVPMSLSWFSMKRGTWVEDLMCALSRCVLSLMSSTV